MNNVNLVGRLINKPIYDYETNTSIITLAITRSCKNDEGYYDTDFIDVLLKGNVANNTADYCNKGDIISITGRLESKYKEDNTKYLIVVADNVTFILN